MNQENGDRDTGEGDQGKEGHTSDQQREDKVLEAQCYRLDAVRANYSSANHLQNIAVVRQCRLQDTLTTRISKVVRSKDACWVPSFMALQ